MENQLELACLSPTGVPTPTITWYHNGKPISEPRNPGIRIFSEEKDQHEVLSTLKIKSASLKDAGVYLCTAKNIGKVY